jgi:DNA repair exonuclease SbcCD ATPase subunit
MAEVKNNVLELTNVVTKLNVVLNENIKNLNSGAAAVDNYNKKFSTIPSEYQKALVDIKAKTDNVSNSNKNLEKTSRQLEQQSIKESNARNALNRQREKAIVAMGKENSAYLQLAKAEAQAARTLQDLIAKGRTANQTQKQYNATLKIAQTNFDQLRAKLIMADSATQRFNRNVGNYRSAFSGMAGGIRQLMSAFGVVGGIFLFAQAIRGAFTTVKDFDKANADLAATMGKTRAEITALTNDQKRLGAITKFTATEVAGLQKEFAKLGFSQKEIINATEATLALAAAVDTDLANAAMVAGSTLRGFGLDASEMGRVTDVMASSFTKSALDIENFKESMKYVAPIAAATGVSMEFTTAMLGKLADAGVKGSQAGTSLRRILAEMAKTGLPTAQAFDKVAKSGISVKDAMDEVGRTAQTSLLVLSKSKDGVLELDEAFKKAGGSAQKMADEQLKSLDGQLTLLASAWDGFILSIQSGEGALSKFFIGAVKQLTTFLGVLSDLGKSQAQLAKESASPIYKQVLKDLDEYSKATVKLRQRAEIDEKTYSERVLRLSKERAAEFLALEEKRLSDLEWDVNSKKSLLEEEEKNASRFGGLYTAASSSIEDAKKALQDNYKEIEKSKEKIRAYTDVLNPAIKSIGAETDATNENTTAKEKKLKVEKQLEEVETNSAASFKRQISFLEHQMAVTNKASSSYGFLEFQVKLLKTAYEALYGAAEKVNKVIDPKYGTSDYYENLISVLKKQQSELATNSNEWQHYNRMIGAVEIDLKNLTGTTEEATKANKEFSDSFRRGFVDDFIGNSGFDKLFYLIENFEQLKESGVDTALAISEAFQQAFNTIAQASQANFNAEYSRLEAQRDFSIDFAGESATAKEEIERQYNERKKAIQKREAEAQKRLAIFNAIIDTAQAVVAALPNYGLAIAVGIIGAAQIALISSQPVPQFYKGTDNAPEGWALTQERGAEVITDKKGNVKTLGNNKGAQMTYLNKGDKVYKSHDDYINKQLSKNGIQEMGGFNLKQKVELNNSFDMDGMKQEFSKLAKVISNKEGVNISIDENGFNKRKGNTSYINSRLTLKSQQV